MEYLTISGLQVSFAHPSGGCAFLLVSMTIFPTHPHTHHIHSHADAIPVQHNRHQSSLFPNPRHRKCSELSTPHGYSMLSSPDILLQYFIASLFMLSGGFACVHSPLALGSECPHSSGIYPYSIPQKGWGSVLVFPPTFPWDS